MLITGTVMDISPLDKVGAKGTTKGGFAINVGDFDKPKPIYFTTWGQFANDLILKKGDDVEVKFNVESRAGSGQWAGRWFTDVVATDVTKVAQSKPQPTPSAKNATPVNQETFKVADNAGGIEDSLPF